MASLANHLFLFLIFPVLLVCSLDNGASTKVGSNGIGTTWIGKAVVDGKTFAICGYLKMAENRTMHIEMMSKFLDYKEPGHDVNHGILFVYPSRLDPKNPIDNNANKVSRRFQLSQKPNYISQSWMWKNEGMDETNILHENLLVVSNNNGVQMATLYNLQNETGSTIRIENGTFKLLESLLGSLKDDKCDDYFPSDKYLEDDYWAAFHWDIVGKKPSEIMLMLIKESSYCEPFEVTDTIGTSSTVINKSTNQSPTSKVVTSDIQSTTSNMFTSTKPTTSSKVDTSSTKQTSTSTTKIQPTTDWPRSNKLTEEQKKEKLKECKRQIDEYNRDNPYLQRTLDEESCLMNIEELREKYHLGDAGEKPYGNKTQECIGSDSDCEPIVPIPKGTLLNINYTITETEQTFVVRKRFRRDAKGRIRRFPVANMNPYCQNAEFDLREKAKSEICRKKIGEIENQNPCESCAFVAATTALTGRHCMNTLIYQSKKWGPIDLCDDKVKTYVFMGELLFQIPFSCPKTNVDNKETTGCHNFLQKMCKETEESKFSIRDSMECMLSEGEFPTKSCLGSTSHERVWEYHIRKKAVSDSCKPYYGKFRDGECCLNPPKLAFCCDAKIKFPCNGLSTCTDALRVLPNQLVLPGSYRELASVRYLSGTEFVETIMKEIMENGPVTAAMDAYEDLMPGLMGKTVYTVSPNAKNLGSHAVRLIGFGENKYSFKKGGPPAFTVKYWIVANSWGEDWNGDGTFRIRQGTNEAGIEERFAFGHFKQYDDIAKLLSWVEKMGSEGLSVGVN